MGSRMYNKYSFAYEVPMLRNKIRNDRKAVIQKTPTTERNVKS